MRIFLRLFQLPREPRRNPLINVLELEEPKFAVCFHLIHRLSPEATAELSPPSTPPIHTQLALAEQALKEAHARGASEGFLLKNLEKDCECKICVTLKS